MKNENENLVVDSDDALEDIALREGFTGSFAEFFPERVSDARVLMDKRCCYTDDWTIVVGIDSDKKKGIIICRATINDIYSSGNYLLGFDTDEYREFTILNPIFFKDVEIACLQKTLPIFFTSVGKDYEVCTPSVVGFRVVGV